MMDLASGWSGSERETRNWSAALRGEGNEAGEGKEVEEGVATIWSWRCCSCWRAESASRVASELVEKVRDILWPAWSSARKLAAKSWSSWSSRPRSRSKGKKK